jgi:RNA polymerase sigma factor (sigma-70 family)
VKDERRNSWAAVFAKHQSRLTGFFRRRVRNTWDAQDLTQEVYLRLLRADEREVIRNPEGYLRTVAGNLLREHAVLRRRAPQSLDPLEFDADLSPELIDAHVPEDDIDRERREAQLAAVLDELPPKCRAVLVMQHRDGLSYQDIAKELGVSTNMVKKHVVKGLAQCRSSLREEE